MYAFNCDNFFWYLSKKKKMKNLRNEACKNCTGSWQVKHDLYLINNMKENLN